MNKYDCVTDFRNAYTKLKITEQEEFAKLANKLLSISMLTAFREKDRDDYFSVLKYLDMYRNYFLIMNCELNYYEKDKVLHLVNLENYNTLRLKKRESIILLTLRKLYYLESKKVSLTENITIRIERLHEELLRTGLFDKRINKSELVECFRLFKKYSLIDIVGKVEDDQTIIVLYPTILHAVKYNTIDEIDKKLKSYDKGGDDNEEISEDSFD